MEAFANYYCQYQIDANHIEKREKHMKYFVDMHDDKMHFITSIGEEKCNEVLQAYNAVDEVLYFYSMGKCVSDALDQLLEWNNTANPSGNYLMRNLHTAERLVRGFLFEFRTCLNYIEEHIKAKHGTKTQLWKIFARNTNKQYSKHPEYAFTGHLRNCAQHCTTVVHGFNGKNGMGISSNSKQLLNDYHEWKPIDTDFINKSGDNIDLVDTFSKAFQTFNAALKPVMEYLLNNNDVGKEIRFLRQWGDYLCKGYGHEIHCYHIFDLQYQDGSSATKEDMDSGNVVVKAYPIDWEVIYELSNSITTTEKSK